MSKFLARFTLAALLALVCPFATSSTFVLFYDDQDSATISGQVNRSDLTNAEKNLATKLWNGGLKNWATAPFALSPTCDDPNTVPVTSHAITITAANTTLQDVVDLLNGLGTRLANKTGEYLIALANDVAACGVQQ